MLWKIQVKLTMPSERYGAAVPFTFPCQNEYCLLTFTSSSTASGLAQSGDVAAYLPRRNCFFCWLSASLRYSHPRPRAQWFESKALCGIILGRVVIGWLETDGNMWIIFNWYTKSHTCVLFPPSVTWSRFSSYLITLTVCPTYSLLRSSSRLQKRRVIISAIILIFWYFHCSCSHINHCDAMSEDDDSWWGCALLSRLSQADWGREGHMVDYWKINMSRWFKPGNNEP